MVVGSSLPATLIAIGIQSSWAGASPPSSWSLIPTPNETSSDSLKAVSCASADFCKAVGYVANDGGTMSVIYQGGRWSQSAVISTTHGDYTLSGVSCVDSHFCVAVGSLSDDGGIFTQIDTWSGSQWVEPSTGRIHSAALSAGSCTSDSDCVAAGYFYTTPLRTRI
jgi:hypothetical protein